jgi:hypothetical protein
MWGQKVLEQDMLDVLLYFSRVHERQIGMNCLTIERWRATSHSRASYVLEIAPEGVVLVPKLGSGGVV